MSFTCSEISVDHIENDCGLTELGGANGIVLLLSGHTVTDASSASEINANIASNYAYLITGVQIGMPEASAETGPAYRACVPDKINNYTRTISIIDANWNSNNIELYNDVFSGIIFGGFIFHLCGADKVLYEFDTELTFQGSPFVPDTNSDILRFTGTGSWKKLTGPLQANTPAGIFS